MFQSTPDLINRENCRKFGKESVVLLFQSTPDLINRENLYIASGEIAGISGFNPLPI